MHRSLTALLVLAVATPAAVACIWDTDTLRDELRGIPEAEVLVVTGRWHRHGKAYYEKRVERLPGHLEARPTDLDAWDDLAVAYEVLGRREEALATLARKAAVLEEHPDDEHRYRLLANRGTVKAHMGRFDDALVDLRAAVELNPDAHFGRERFQIRLIEYIAEARTDPTVTSRSFLAWAGLVPENAASFAVNHAYDSGGLRALLGKARKDEPEGIETVAWNELHEGIAGMLRFGGLEGPELYRVLGDLYLLRAEGGRWGNLNLAWWAYRRAIDRGHVHPKPLRDALRRIEEHWAEADKIHRKRMDRPDEADFQRMKTLEARWLGAFQAAEADALAAGEDPGTDAVLQRLLKKADAAIASAD